MVTEYDDDASRRTLANQLALWVDEQAGAYPECVSLVVQASSVAVTIRWRMLCNAHALAS
jgi:hypothetical protein